METRIQNLERIVRRQNQNKPDDISRSLIQDVVVKSRERERATSLQSIQDDFIAAANRIGLTLKNFTEVCKFAVSFVEDNCFQIANLVGSAILGSIKFDIACKLVASLFIDIAFELIGQTIESQHTLMINRKKHMAEISSVEDKVIQFPKNEPPFLKVQKKSRKRDGVAKGQ